MKTLLRCLIIILPVTSICAILAAAIPIVDDQDSIVSRQEVVEYFESMNRVVATIDRPLNIKLDEVLESIFPTKNREDEK